MLDPSSQRQRPSSPSTKSINEFFSSKSAFDNFMSQIFLPRQREYNQSMLQFYANTFNFKQQHFRITNKEGQKLSASLFYKCKGSQNNLPQTCIVYCHGFGSSRIEATHILKVLGEDIGLCCFDFSGAGKSEGSIITYGAKEKQDINSVIAYLKQQLKFTRFVLWGRSMGATACLLYSLKYEQSQQISKRNVVFQVVDSPFVSFQKIAIQMSKKSIYLPEFGASILLNMLRKNCDKLQSYNPFSVDLSNISQCKVPTLFVYSQSDEIVSHQNSEYLCQRFTGFYQKLVIQQKHNTPRSRQILSEVVRRLEIQLSKCQITKNTGLIFRSLMSTPSNKSKSNKKGIQRSLSKQGVKVSKVNKQQSPQIKRNSDYYVELNQKYQTPNPRSKRQCYLKNLQSNPNNMWTQPRNNEIRNYQSPVRINTHQSTIETLKSREIENKFSSVHSRIGFKNSQYKERQTQQNIYQMKRPKIFEKTNSKPQRTSIFQINKKTEDPAAKFVRQFDIEEDMRQGKYRCNQKRPSSALAKINISLSALKDVNKSSFSPHLSKEQFEISIQNDSKQLHFDERIKNQINYSPFASFEVKESTRLNSFNSQFYLSNPAYQTTKLSQNSSLSTSIENVYTIKQPMNFNKELCREKSESKNQVKEKSISSAKKYKCSQVICYDKSTYRYGL